MLIAIDIGNTTANFGFFKHDKLLFKRKIPTARLSIASVKSLFGTKAKVDQIEDILVCSVVPKATKRIKRIIKNITGLDATIIGKDIKVPIVNLYKNKSQVGQDRLVNAIAGIFLYGCPVIIVDFGTAITFDVVSKKGEYTGGIIFPGLRLSLAALSKRAALLPKIKVKTPKVLVGKDTTTSMLSGITYGVASLCDGMIARIKVSNGGKTKVVATGGDALFISKHARNIKLVDPDLTLKGLCLIHKLKRHKKVRKRTKTREN